MAEVVEEVKRIDQDDARYRQMLSEPWYPGETEPETMRDDTFVTFLSHIFDQPHAQAYRRNRSRWGIKQEQLLYRMYKRPLDHGIRMLHKNLLTQCRKISGRKV